MITLREACNIVQVDLETDNCFIRNNCKDLGDFWVFDWGWKDDPEALRVGIPMIKVEKNTGRIGYFDLGTPREENFKQFMKAPEIDISEYL